MPLLVYDGDCAFCTSCVVFIERHLPTTAQMVPWQTVDLAGLGVRQEQAEREVVWVDRGTNEGGAQAVAALLIDSGGWWRILGYAVRMPPVRWLAHLSYRLISRYRHRLPGGTPTCALPAARRSADRH